MVRRLADLPARPVRAAARPKTEAGVRAPMTAPLVDVREAARRHASREALLLDVREPAELAIAAIAGALHVPMRQVPQRLAELPRDRPVLVLCHHGGRSQVVADWLLAKGFAAQNVAGGIDAWTDEVDPSVPKY
jgi:rhodanese-related sulfurtransferase